jgi:hypothetical protein
MSLLTLCAAALHPPLIHHNQIAVEGCCHGELDNIYATLEYMQQAKGKKIDLLICCGDFQVCLMTSLHNSSWMSTEV